MTYRMKVAMILLVWAASAASTVRADIIAGCAIPLVPNPELLLDQPWEPQGLGLFLKKGGAVVDYTDKEGRPTRIAPHIELWSGNGSSKPVSSLVGRAVEIAEPGRIAFGEIINTLFDDVAESMEKYIRGDKYEVTSVETLEHDQRLRWSDRRATAALTFWFPTGEGAPEANHHMLVLFIVGGDLPH